MVIKSRKSVLVKAAKNAVLWSWKLVFCLKIHKEYGDLSVDDFSFATDLQADWVLPAARPPREAGERQEEAGKETTVHAPGILGTLLPLRETLSRNSFQKCHIFFFNLLKCQTAVVSFVLYSLRSTAICKLKIWSTAARSQV